MKRAVCMVALFAAVFCSPCRASALEFPETQLLATSEGNIAYDDTGGAGPAVVALPGIGEVRQQYRFLRPLFQRAGIRFVTMDPRGQGASSVRWPDYTARSGSEDVLRLVDKLHAPKVILIGNSFSAAAVLLAAHSAPEKIAAVVLIGPVVRDEPSSALTRAAVRLAFEGPWATALWMRYWDSLFPGHRPVDFATYRAALRANLDEPGRINVLRAQIALPKSEANDIIDMLRLSNLIVMGDKDPDFKSPEATARALAARLRSQPLIIKGAGHYPHVEVPDLVCPRIVAFTEEVIRGGPG